MHRTEHMSPRHVAGWSVVGMAAGFLAGLLLGEWFGPTPPRRGMRLAGGSRARRLAGPLRGTELSGVVRTALAADPTLTGLAVRAVGPGRVEVSGWVPDRATRTRAARVVLGLPAVDSLINSVLVRGEDDQRRFPDLRLTDQSA